MKLHRIAWSSLDSRDLGREIIREVRHSGAIIVTDLPDQPDDQALLDLAGSIGRPRRQALLGASKGAYVFALYVRPNPMKNSFGREIASHSSGHFDWHTDEFFTMDPAHVVLLHCVRPDTGGGGASLLCHVDEVVRRLDPSQLKQLQRAVFPHPCGRVSILQLYDGTWLVRYNRALMEEEVAKRGTSLDQETRSALAAFEEAIALSREQIALAPQDCLVLDNLRILHGRTAFRAESARLFKRVRLLHDDWPKLSAVVPN